MIRVCVFAGSSGSVEVKYLDAARALGTAIARRGMGMVYGGGAVGLMGACADAALQGHTEVVGVLPRALARSEVAHPNLTELRIVKTLHDRKAVMAALSDGYVAPLVRFLQDATAAGFVGPAVLEALPVRSSPDELLSALFR